MYIFTSRRRSSTAEGSSGDGVVVRLPARLASELSATLTTEFFPLPARPDELRWLGEIGDRVRWSPGAPGSPEPGDLRIRDFTALLQRLTNIMATDAISARHGKPTEEFEEQGFLRDALLILLTEGPEDPVRRAITNNISATEAVRPRRGRRISSRQWARSLADGAEGMRSAHRELLRAISDFRAEHEPPSRGSTPSQ